WEEFDTDDGWFSEQVVTGIRHLFGHSLDEAKRLLARYLESPDRRPPYRGSESVFSDDEGHDGPEGGAYMGPWSMALGKALYSEEFHDWRRTHYQARRYAR